MDAASSPPCSIGSGGGPLAASSAAAVAPGASKERFGDVESPPRVSGRGFILTYEGLSPHARTASRFPGPRLQEMPTEDWSTTIESRVYSTHWAFGFLSTDNFPMRLTSGPSSPSESRSDAETNFADALAIFNGYSDSSDWSDDGLVDGGADGSSPQEA